MTEKLDNELKTLLIERRNLIVKCEKLDEEMGHHKSEIGMIDSELRHILENNDLKEVEKNGFKCFFKPQTSAKVIDLDKIINWMKKNDRYDILRADLIKKTEINKLIKDGIIPDGIKIYSWEEFKVHKTKKID